MNKVFLYLLYIFSYLFDIFENFFHNIGKNKYFKEYSVIAYEYYNNIFIYINNLDIEPKVPYIQLSYFSKNNKLTNELLVASYDFNKSNTNIESYFMQTFARTKHLHYKDILFTCKYISDNKHYIISKVLNKSNLNLENLKKNSILQHSDKTDKSNNPFLAIEYSHKLMENTLPIDIDNKYFIEGNDILNNLFILKYLKINYNKNDYIFDNDYTITIIDDSAIIHILDYNSYIQINHDNSWEIIKN